MATGGARAPRRVAGARARKRTRPEAAAPRQRADHAEVQLLQQAVGNRAVTSLLTPDVGTPAAGTPDAGTPTVLTGRPVQLTRTVQRAPATQTRDRSPAAFGETVVPAPPVNEAPVGPGAVSRPAGLSGGATPVGELEVLGQFSLDPTKVIRSPHANWHEQMYRLDGGQGSVPMAFRVGDLIAVHPDNSAPASPLPGYSAEDAAGSGPAGSGATAPASLTEAAGATANAAPRPGSATVGTAPPPEPGRRRVAARPPGWDTAKPATLDEVEAVHTQDPSRVMRSPSDYWHEQMFSLDQGEGDEAPVAFRVGGQYLVAPGYKGKATALDPAAEQSRVAELTKGAALPGLLMNEQGRLGSKTMTMSGEGADTEVVSHATRLGERTDGTEVTHGDVVHTTKQTAGPSFMGDGNVFGYGSGNDSSVAWRDGDDSASSARSSRVSAGLGPNGAKLGASSSQETVVTNGAGETVRTASNTSGAFTLGPSGYGATGAHSSTSATGTTSSVNAGATADFDGNYDANAGVAVANKDGMGGSATVGKGHHVTAGEPVEVSPGVWEVHYAVNDSLSVGAGASGSSNGFGVGASGGESSATLHTGSRRFASEKDALAFQKHPNSVTDFDSFDAGAKSITDAAGALAIPVGEARGLGDSDTLTGSVSASFEGATVGRSGHSTSGHELTVRRVSDTLVQVTTAVSTDKGSDWSISGLGLTNDSGGSTSHLYEVTYEFDLANAAGKESFQTFCRVLLPPAGARRVSVHALDSEEDHDRYKLLGGTAGFEGKTWQDRVTTDAGDTTRFGGSQGHDVSPGRVWKFLGDKESHSNAQIVRTDENGKDVGARAELDVSGESGEANRAEFAKIFGTSDTPGDAKASGTWTLTSAVPVEAIRELEKVSPMLRAATTMDEKMAVYSTLVKEHGAQMLGGQVGMTSTSWDLQLKGDANFPGEAGRRRINEHAKELRARLTAKPANSYEVMHEADDELGALRKRRAAVADTKQYTDLPGRLRKEQLAVIDTHITAFANLRRNAQAVSMRTSGGEATSSDGGYTAGRDRITGYEAAIGNLSKQVHDDSKALGDAIGRHGTAALRAGVDRNDAEQAVAMAKALIARATDADAKQGALDAGINAARDAWTAASDPKDRLAAVQKLSDLLAERVRLMKECVGFIAEAGKAIGPVASASALSSHPTFWASIGISAPGD